MGAWYAFDDVETKGQDLCMKERLYWYEKSAFKGYLPAMQAIAGLYDNGDDTEILSLPTDLKKSAFWYRHGALNGEPMCAYNLGVMYSQGDFVEKNRDVAKMWLSLSYKNNDDPSFANQIQQFAKQFDIQLINTPNINQDPELNNTTSEFQDAYDEDSNNDLGSTFSEWLENNCNHVEFEPKKIEKWSDLELISLQANHLSELPKEISILKGLIDLNLCQNNFKTFPTELESLSSLERLDLSFNQLINIPSNIKELINLKTLSLGLNKISKLPIEIGQLKKVEILYLYENNLSELPKEIGEMVALRHLSLYKNNLCNLPDEILSLSNLESIELQNNNFTDEDAKKWVDRLGNTKCKISFGYQQGNISEPIYVETNIKGGNPEDSFLEMYLNSQDGDIVSNIFRWSSSGADESNFLSMYLANKKYSKISISKGLNAIRAENIIVPIHMKMNAETPSAEDELIEWVKITYIETCNEHNLKPNPKLHIMSVGSSGSEKTLEMIER